MATSGVEFSFNNAMYRWTDVIAMDSPLGPVLANIFVSYNENKLLDFYLNHNFTKDMWITPLPFLKMKPSAVNFSTF